MDIQSEEDSKNNNQENLSELGYLLQKKRNKEKTDKISEILNSDLTVKEKISRIKEIDETNVYSPEAAQRIAVEEHR